MTDGREPGVWRRATVGVASVVLLAGASALAAATTSEATTGPVTKAGPLPSGTVTATKRVGGFAFLEGPVWDPATGSVLMSNMKDATGPQKVQPSSILRFTAQGTVETVVANSGSNGMATGRTAGTVLAATHDPQAVSEIRLSDGVRTALATGIGGKTFNSPNDLTVARDGTIYFTDPSFQRGDRPDQQAGRTGVYRLSNGVVTLVDGTVAQPNGIVLSPDGRTLYVGAFNANAILAYPVAADGTVGAAKTFATVNGPDGATIDTAGNLYWASFNDGKIHVIDPQGTEIGTVTAGTHTTNAAFGGPDRRTLFVTSGVQGDFGLYSVTLNIAGNAF